MKGCAKPYKMRNCLSFYLYSLACPFLRLIKFYHLHFDMLLKSRNFAL